MKCTRGRWNTLIRPLALGLIFGPALAPVAEAQRLRDSAAAFHAYGSATGVEAENGFSIQVVNGEWRHEGHAHVGGSGSITSPWGEEMPLRFWINGDGSLAVEFDGRAVLHYLFDERGVLDRVIAVTPERSRTARARGRSERFAAGALTPDDPDFYNLDVGPYELLLNEIAGRHSVEFLEGVDTLRRKLERTGSLAPVGCAGDILTCTGAILLWAGSVGTIAAACTAGNAFTLGAGCLAAILAHEGAGAAAAGACINAIQNCMEEDQRDSGSGCSDPGGGTE